MENTKELPRGWTEIGFKDACVKVSLNGIKVKEKEYKGIGNYPVIDQGQSLIGGYFDDEELLVPGEPPFIVFGDHTKAKKYINFRFIAGGDGLKVLKAKGFFDPKLFFYFIHSIKLPDKGYARHFQYLEKSKIPIPPLPEQQRIIFKIEKLFSELDKGIESLRIAQQQLKVYRQAVLKWAFEGKLTEDWRKEQGIKEDTWSRHKLGDYIEKIEAGKSFKCIEQAPLDDEIGVIKVSAVTWGTYDENESKTCPDMKKIKPEYFIRNGDFLFSRANTLQLVGTCVIANEVKKKIMLSDKILRIIFLNINFKYCLFYLRSKYGRYEIERLSTGNQASMRNIGQDRIKSININVCSIKEQEQIIWEIESRLSICDKLEATIEQSLAKAEALRQSILKKAFEGRLVSQNPNDEPAGKLLERRAEREAKKPEKRTTKRRTK